MFLQIYIKLIHYHHPGQNGTRGRVVRIEKFLQIN